METKNKEKDKCVICHKFTPYTKNTNININDRSYYVEGVGQLCQDCYNKIYTIKDKNGRYMGNN